MALPVSRSEFGQYCLTKLGKPVINIEVSDNQLDLCIEDALQIYRDYHYDATLKVYYKHKVTADDKARRYITVPDDIQGITRIFDITGLSTGTNIFDIRYQIALNDLYTLTTVSMVPYFMTMQHLEFLEQLLVGAKPIRFERHTNRLYIDMDWNTIDIGLFIVAEAYQDIDPDIYTDVWHDRWLLQMGTALVKKQWGNNLKKYPGIQMPGGVTFSGQQIYDEAEAEIEDLKAKVINDFSEPLGYLVG